MQDDNKSLPDAVHQASQAAAMLAGTAPQISVLTMNAFGIRITSRYGRATEMAQMLNFCHEAARMCVTHQVVDLFYDSGADLCSIQTRDSADRDPDVADSLERAAAAHLSQYELFGFIGHGLKGIGNSGGGNSGDDGEADFLP